MDNASARQAEDLGSNRRVCQIFDLFRCVLSSLLHLRGVGWSNFDKGLRNLTTYIKNTTQINDVAKLYMYVYIYFIIIPRI